MVGSMAGPERWTEFLAAGSRTAAEFRDGWGSLAGEAAAVWTYLGEVPSGALAAPLEAAGGNCVDGGTRGKVVQQLEGLRHKLLTRALATHPDRDARPVTVFPNVADDKCAGSWLLALPSPDLAMSAATFKEALSSHLCLPSPALREGGWVGRPVGTDGKVVDRFGDTIQCDKTIPGDTWRRRHDTVKQHLYLEAALSKVPVDCEVYGLFGDLLPAALTEVGGELQWGRARQGKVPDFRFLFPSPEGPVSRLAELKVISAGPTLFPRGGAGRGTQRRANKLTSEYETVLRGYDVRFHGAEPRVDGEPEPPPGPLLTRFRGFGALCEGQLVAGPWGDLSPHLHQLLRTCAESRVAATGRARGWEAGPGELGKVMGDVRRAVSVVVVRAQAMCLLERLAHLGPGAGAAAKRREATLRQEERRRREREAFTLAQQARGASRLGRAFVP
jgi:hypothetical protein